MTQGVHAGAGRDLGRQGGGHTQVQNRRVRQQVGGDILLLHVLFRIGDHRHWGTFAASTGSGGHGDKGNMPSGGEDLTAHQRLQVRGVLTNDHPNAFGSINDTAAAYCQYTITAGFCKEPGDLIDHRHGGIRRDLRKHSLWHCGAHMPQDQVHSAHLHQSRIGQQQRRLGLQDPQLIGDILQGALPGEDLYRIMIFVIQR